MILNEMVGSSPINETNIYRIVTFISVNIFYSVFFIYLKEFFSL